METGIIKIAELVSAVSIILAAVVGAYKIFDRLSDKVESLDKRITDLEKENTDIKRENAIVIFALRACLDGLHQQGCNGKVTEAIKKIDKHINLAAHNLPD